MARIPSSEHARHGKFGRLTRSKHLQGFLQARATSLSLNSREVYEDLKRLGSRILWGSTTSRPVNRTKPTITGTATSGQTLTRAVGTWGGKPAPTLTYKWYRDGVVIAGQTGTTLVLSAPDVGKRITVEEIGTNTAGNRSVKSAATAIISA